jgi:hypothetical protein
LQIIPIGAQSSDIFFQRDKHMSLEFSLFAKISKTCLIAHREWVIYRYGDYGSVIYELEEMLRDPSEGLDCEWILFYLEDCLNRHYSDKDLSEQQKDYARFWIEHMVNFVKERPNDIFFVLDDVNEEYCDTIKTCVATRPI